MCGIVTHKSFWKVDKWCFLLFWPRRKSKTMPLPVAKDKTGQRWEPGHQPLLEKQNGGTLKIIPYFHFELISNGEERENLKCYPHYFTDSTKSLGCRCASKVNQNFEQNIADDCHQWVMRTIEALDLNPKDQNKYRGARLFSRKIVPFLVLLAAKFAYKGGFTLWNNKIVDVVRFPHNRNINYAYSSLFNRKIAESMELLWDLSALNNCKFSHTFRLTSLKVKLRKTETKNNNFRRIYRILKLSAELKLLQIIAI